MIDGAFDDVFSAEVGFAVIYCLIGYFVAFAIVDSRVCKRLLVIPSWRNPESEDCATLELAVRKLEISAE